MADNPKLTNHEYLDDVRKRFRHHPQLQRAFELAERGLSRTALKQPRTQWQPIETAPKTPDMVLICEGNSIVTARWSGEGHIYHTGETHGIYDDPVEYNATHWMELPEPPEASRG